MFDRLLDLMVAIGRRIPTDVSLPKHLDPKFPANCILCNAEHPDSHLEYRTRDYSDATFNPTTWLGSSMNFKVPTCSQCLTKLNRERIFRKLVFWSIVVSALALSFYLFAGFRFAWWRRWATIGILILALIPYGIWQMLCPPALDVSVDTEKIEYQFRNRKYAKAFSFLNKGEVESDPRDELDELEEVLEEDS